MQEKWLVKRLGLIVHSLFRDLDSLIGIGSSIDSKL